MDLIKTQTTKNRAHDDAIPRQDEETFAHPAATTPTQPISTLLAMFTAPFRPAWVGEHTTSLPLRRAWVIHFAAALATIWVIFLMMLWANWPSLGPTSFAELIREARQEIGLLIDELYRYPIESVCAVLGMIAMVEGMHMFLAAMTMGWGAKDEPLRKSFASAVRQTWLANTRFVVAAFIIGGPLAYIEHEDQTWRNTNPGPVQPNITWPSQPTLAETNPGFSKAMATYKTDLKAAQDKWGANWTARREWLAKRPWLLNHPEAIGIPLGFLTALWFVWALFRSIGATRNVPPILRDQRCIECGYNLHTIPMESRCPECGKPVIESLGPNVHPGTSWENRKRDNTLRIWWTCGLCAMTNPKALGQSLKVSYAGTSHRRFLAVNLIAIGLVGAGAVLASAYLFREVIGLAQEPEMLLLIPLAVGSSTLMGALAVASIGVMLVGLGQSLIHKRNLLPSAMQVGSYLSGFLLFWASLGAMGILALMWMDHSGVIAPMAKAIGFQSDVLATLLFFVPNCACGACFLKKLVVGTSATRFANR